MILSTRWYSSSCSIWSVSSTCSICSNSVPWFIYLLACQLCVFYFNSGRLYISSHNLIHPCTDISAKLLLIRPLFYLCRFCRVHPSLVLVKWDGCHFSQRILWYHKHSIKDFKHVLKVNIFFFLIPNLH